MRRVLRDGSEFPIERKAEKITHQRREILKFCPFAHEYLEMLQDEHGLAGFIPSGEGVLLMAEMLDLTHDGDILMLTQPVCYITPGEIQGLKPPSEDGTK